MKLVAITSNEEIVWINPNHVVSIVGQYLFMVSGPSVKIDDIDELQSFMDI